MKRRYKYILPKRNYFQYLALLCLAFVLFTAYALMPDDIRFSVSLKKQKLPLSLEKRNDHVNQNNQKPTAKITKPDTSRMEQSVQCADVFELLGTLDTSHQRFLLIGDSMGEYLRLRLNDYCAKNGHSMKSVIWYSSSTEIYGSCDTLSHFIETYNPTYVLLVLGSNELFIRDIKDKRDAYVKHILAEIGDLPYIWIGPPNWKEDTGINDLIVENVGAGHYFESKRLSYVRGSDHAHPVKSSAYMWMDSIAHYLYHGAAHRVVMEMPDHSISKTPPTVLIPPKRS